MRASIVVAGRQAAGNTSFTQSQTGQSQRSIPNDKYQLQPPPLIVVIRRRRRRRSQCNRLPTAGGVHPSGRWPGRRPRRSSQRGPQARGDTAEWAISLHFLLNNMLGS